MIKKLVLRKITFSQISNFKSKELPYGMYSAIKLVNPLHSS